MPAQWLKPGEFGRTFPKLDGMPIDELPGPLPCCCFVCNIKVDPKLYVPSGIDDVNAKVRHDLAPKLANGTRLERFETPSQFVGPSRRAKKP